MTAALSPTIEMTHDQDTRGLERTRAELAFLYAHDTDSFNRWDAGQTLLTEVILDLAQRASRREELVMDSAVVDAVRRCQIPRQQP